MDTLESDAEDDSVGLRDTTTASSDLSDLSNSHYQKLQQLKVWQAAQEEKLMEEQRKQISHRMEELDISENDVAEMEAVETDDNNTEADVDEESLATESLKFVQSPGPAPEERPVAGGGKTFEQLLAEKLGEESESGKMAPALVTPKPFLKKFSGLARFNHNTSDSNSPVSGGKNNSLKNSAGRPSSIKKVSPQKSENRKVSSQLLGSSDKSKSKQKHVSIVSPPKTLRLKAAPVPAPAPVLSSARYDLSDSVENSFCDRLVVQASRQEKDQAEVAVFQMLESAANDASFCSDSSRIQNLVTAAVLPSPHRQRPGPAHSTNPSSVLPAATPRLQSSSKSFVSSTPAPNMSSSSAPTLGLSYVNSTPALPTHNTETPSPAVQAKLGGQGDVTSDQSLGESIMDDIKKFLAARFVEQSKQNTEGKDENKIGLEDDSEWTDESDDDTIEDDSQDVTIGRNWKENIPPQPQPKLSNNENELLTFSPPEKLPPNPPSRLIWDIFGRENEKKRQEAEKRKPQGVKNAPIRRRKSAPLGVRFDTEKNNVDKQIGGGETDENVSYQSTLLHMRVVELEQEIAAFKQENKKIVNVKKKLQSDKEILAKQLSDFEELRSSERKKLEEEKRRIKRDLTLLEKSKKIQAKCKKCEDSKIDKEKIVKDHKLKEVKLTDEISKLRDQLKKLKRENQQLENENQKFKLRSVGSKVNLPEENDTEVVITKHNLEKKKNEDPELEVPAPTLDACEDSGVQIREKVFDDGHKEIWFSNGNRKEVSRDGRHVKVFYYNGDVKETSGDGSERFLYSQTQTWHTRTADGTEILQFSSGQQETRTRDGTTSISFPDGTVKTVTRTGRETLSQPDGTRVTIEVNGDRRVELPNGQVEEHSAASKRRIYPDGTVKILHADGRTETRYAGGRVRVRDAAGNLTQDSG